MASDVFYTTNPAEFALLEGLYVHEKNPPGFIKSASLSTVGIGGATVRGPSEATFVGSTARFLEIYGGRDRGSGGALVNEVWAALLSKPFGGIYVRRVVAVDAVVATETFDDTATPVLKVDASSAGAWGIDLTVAVEDATNEDATAFNLVVAYLGGSITYENLKIEGADDDNLSEVVGDDPARWVTLSKVADGRPDNFVAQVLTTAGDDGTAVDADYTAALTELANTEGIAIVTMAGAAADQNDLNGEIVSLAALAVDRVFVTWSGTHGQAAATEATNAGTDITTRSDRIIWCFNSPYVKDPETGLQIQRGPHEHMASVLAANDVDVHPGARQTSKQLAGIRKLTNEALTRVELIALKAAGVCTLERLSDLYLFRSGVTTSLVTGLTEITRRRMADLLQISAAAKLRESVKAKNTAERRALIAGLLVGYSQSMRDKGKIVEDFSIDQESVNTAGQRAQGIEKVLWQVKLIGHILALVLETEIGTGVVIEA